VRKGIWCISKFGEFNERSEILNALQSFEHNLETAISDEVPVQNLQTALTAIGAFEKPEHKFSGFCRAFLNNSKSYQSVKSMIAGDAAC
jgi:hypothetical protein